MPAPLALPWPAWCTDDSGAAALAMYRLNDEELAERYRDGNLFFQTHNSTGKSGWRVSAAQMLAFYNVDSNLRAVLSDRFVGLVESRMRVIYAARRAA